MTTKQRIDSLLVARGLETSRTRAQARIIAGEVIVNDHRVDKPGTLVAEDADIRLKGTAMPYVSRGGFKLKAALDKWPPTILTRPAKRGEENILPADKKCKDAICLDIGASTGGFTDVLLQEGAAKVYAVDVGHNQLHFSLRQNPKVIVYEKTHILKVPIGIFNPAPSIVVIDVSFISLTTVLPAAIKHCAPEAFIYTLIKPQFEVGKNNISKGGIVKDEMARNEAVNNVIKSALSHGLQLIGLEESPITGADGNVEYIAAFCRNH